MAPDRRDVLHGTLYPALIKLEQAGWSASAWRQSESGRRVKVYTLTGRGRKQLQAEEASWLQVTNIVARFFKDPRGRVMPRLLSRFWRLWQMSRPSAADADLRKEIDSHLEEAAEESRSRGLSADAVRREALRQFGGVLRTREGHKEARSFTWADDCRRDVRLSLRSPDRGTPLMSLSTRERWRPCVAARDFVAGMTDRYAVRLFEELFIPKPWNIE